MIPKRFKHSKASKRKMSESHRGKKNHFYGKKHTEKAKLKIGLASRGRKANLGNHHSEEAKRKMSKAAKQRIGIKNSFFSKKHSGESRRKISLAHLGIKMGPMKLETKLKIGKANSGSNQWNWKGGITPLVTKIRNCFLYRQWRSDIFTRDNFTCQICGKRGGKLEADHYPKKFSQVFSENKITTFLQAMMCEEFWNINNGRTLCVLCHYKNKK